MELKEDVRKRIRYRSKGTENDCKEKRGEVRQHHMKKAIKEKSKSQYGE